MHWALEREKGVMGAEVHLSSEEHPEKRGLEKRTIQHKKR